MVDESIVKGQGERKLIQHPLRKRWMMGRALSDDLRLRVLKASAAGMSARQSAARFGVGISMVTLPPSFIQF